MKIIIILLIILSGMITKVFSQTMAEARETFADRIEFIIQDVYRLDTVMVSVGGVDNVRLHVYVRGERKEGEDVMTLLQKKGIIKSLYRFGFVTLLYSLNQDDLRVFRIKEDSLNEM